LKPAEAGWLGLVLLSGATVVLGSARSAPAVPAAPVSSTAATATHSAALPVPSASSSAGADERASCEVPDRGLGLHGEWHRVPLGRLSYPLARSTDAYDLVVHFHGGDSARRLIAPERLGVALVAVDAGEGSSAYEKIIGGATVLDELIDAVDKELAPAKLGRLVLTAWSAGYGALRQLLRHHPMRPDAVVLLDALHTSYDENDGSLLEEGLTPFLDYAARAQDGDGLLVLTHSEIRPPGYASTSEVASYLIDFLGGQRRYAGLAPSFGVEAKTEYRGGQVIVRGFTGGNKEAHCAHLKMLLPVLRDDVLPTLRGNAPKTP
jgi:hypothetical protein